MKTSFNLSIAATMLAAFAALAGLFVTSIYQDNAFVQTAWRGNDWVSLLAVIPAMLITLLQVKRGRTKFQLVWMGLLGYLAYNYAFYLFGAAYNTLFLVYVLIFSLSVFALISGLYALPVHEIRNTAKSTRWIIAYLLLIAFILCMVEVPPNITYLFSGKLPETVVLTGHPTAVVYALDLSLVVPISIVASVCLWQQKPWGYVLAVIMLIKGASYGLVLVVNSILLKYSGTGEDNLLPFYLFVMLGGLAGLFWMMKHIHTFLYKTNLS